MNDLPGSPISRLSRRTLGNNEGAESGQLNFLVLLEGCGDCTEHGVEGRGDRPIADECWAAHTQVGLQQSKDRFSSGLPGNKLARFSHLRFQRLIEQLSRAKKSDEARAPHYRLREFLWKFAP